MNEVEILGWSSSCNFLTAGNNSIHMRVRNKNAYPVMFKIAIQLKSGSWETHWDEFKLGGNSIAEYHLLGPAFQKSPSIRIERVR